MIPGFVVVEGRRAACNWLIIAAGTAPLQVTPRDDTKGRLLYFTPFKYEPVTRALCDAA
jgi:hypothetical protein